MSKGQVKPNHTLESLHTFQDIFPSKVFHWASEKDGEGNRGWKTFLQKIVGRWMNQDTKGSFGEGKLKEGPEAERGGAEEEEKVGDVKVENFEMRSYRKRRLVNP